MTNREMALEMGRAMKAAGVAGRVDLLHPNEQVCVTLAEGTTCAQYMRLKASTTLIWHRDGRTLWV